MDFKQYINQAWSSHAQHTKEVIHYLPQGIQLLKNEDEALQLAKLIFHLATEHQFDFEKFLTYLLQIDQLSFYSKQEVKSQIKRQIITLKYLIDKTEDISKLSISERVQIFASVAATHFYKNDLAIGYQYLKNSVAATHSLPASDEAIKFIAMIFNNVAGFFSEKKILSEDEQKLMIETAIYSKTFWEKTNQWMNIERADYFLSKYYRLLNQNDQALQHAESCLIICKTNNASPVETFFAYEAMALSFKQLNDENSFSEYVAEAKNCYQLCTVEDQKWMHQSLKNLEVML